MYRRVRVLPPVEQRVFNVLQAKSVAVLDPFPVGMHLQVLEAMMAGVPVVSIVLHMLCYYTAMYCYVLYLC